MPHTLMTMFAAAALWALAGCSGSESTEFAEDGRAQDNPINNTNEGVLAGRALDGYLRDAFVWLDLDQNGQLDEGEPSTMTTAGGRFTLDITSLQRDPTVGADLDPRDYPLMLLAIPGQTVDEDDGEAVETGFLLMAPPGLTIITPFTTLIEFERRLHVFSEGTVAEKVTEATRRVKERLGPDVSGFSLHGDYTRSDNARAAAYGQTIAAFLEVQTRPEWKAALVDGDRDVFNSDLINVLGGLTLAQVPDLMAQATALLEAEGVANFDTDKLTLLSFELDGLDPYVIRQQRLYMKREFSKNSIPEDMTSNQVGLVGYTQSENLSAELSYFYDAAGRLIQIDVRGRTDPDLTQLLQLIQVRGRVSRLDTQLSPGLMVRYSTADDLDQTLDERYRFIWDEGRIEWDTTNPEYGSAVNELDGIPEHVITWSVADNNGPVTAVELSRRGGERVQGLEIDYGAGAAQVPSGYRFIGPAGAVEKTWAWSATDNCEIITVYDGVNTAAEPVVRHYQTFSEPGVYDEPRLLNITRTVDYAAVPEPVNVEWVSVYYDGFLASGVLDSRQPQLLRERVLKYLMNPPTDCQGGSRSGSSDVLAVAQYEYQRLSARVSGQLPGE